MDLNLPFFFLIYIIKTCINENHLGIFALYLKTFQVIIGCRYEQFLISTNFNNVNKNNKVNSSLN